MLVSELIKSWRISSILKPSKNWFRYKSLLRWFVPLEELVVFKRGLGRDRCLVSPISGTTHDSIDIEVEGKQYRLIDTAGIRRKGAEHEVVDKFAAIRTERALERALERADLCLLIIDANEGLTTQEKRIARKTFAFTGVPLTFSLRGKKQMVAASSS
ncbi:MAG: 50S ribosome-binding GTPase [Simkaniaceae bacterium]|nr:50S ribosome-binding GTPase [Candidatus Sacchlamyda saccharinae]